MTMVDRSPHNGQPTAGAGCNGGHGRWSVASVCCRAASSIEHLEEVSTLYISSFTARIAVPRASELSVIATTASERTRVCASTFASLYFVECCVVGPCAEVLLDSVYEDANLNLRELDALLNGDVPDQIHSSRVCVGLSFIRHGRKLPSSESVFCLGSRDYVSIWTLPRTSSICLPLNSRMLSGSLCRTSKGMQGFPASESGYGGIADACILSSLGAVDPRSNGS